VVVVARKIRWKKLHRKKNMCAPTIPAVKGKIAPRTNVKDVKKVVRNVNNF